MADLFASGRVIDLILALMLVEGLALTLYRHFTKRGIEPLDLLANFLAGGFLLLALRNALVMAGWMPVALCLSAALLAHFADLARRWK